MSHERRLYDGGRSHSRCRALIDVVLVKRKVTNIEQANLFLFNPLGPNPSSSLSPMFFFQSRKESPPNECECRILLSHASETYAPLADDSLLLPVSFTGVRNGLLRSMDYPGIRGRKSSILVTFLLLCYNAMAKTTYKRKLLWG